MSKAELMKLTVAKLKALCQEKGITIPSGSKKADIVKLILESGATQEKSDKKAPAKKAPKESGDKTDSKLQKTQRKSMEYIKKEHVVTRTMEANWYLSSYKYKYNITHMQPFLEKMKEKKLVGLQCSNCNRVFFAPKLVCGNCLIKPDRWVDIRETGRISTFTVSYLVDDKTGEVIQKPIVLVQHDGSDTTWLAELSPGVRYQDTYIGMPVKVKWREDTEGSIDDIEYYEPLEDNAKDIPLRKDY